jgi:indolepyruvate ferredoxin oxidoreductase
MTGGQPVDGTLTVPQLTRQLAAEDVGRIIVMSDEPEKYGASPTSPPASTSAIASELDETQRELRETPGVTALDLRPDLRRRKAPPAQARQLPRPRRAHLHQPGGVRGLRRLRSQIQLPRRGTGGNRIRPQAGHRPVRLQQGLLLPRRLLPEHRHCAWRQRTARPGHGSGAQDLAALPEPAPASLADPCGILVAGVGGTGVVTIGALLGMAAHLDGKGVTVLDMTGLAQKGGAVMSHVRLADARTACIRRGSPPAKPASCSAATSSLPSATTPCRRPRPAIPAPS